MALVPHAPHSVREVRRALAADLRTRGLARHVVDDAVLVASEIVSNALKHAKPLGTGGIRVCWVLHTNAVEVRVTDGGAGTLPRVATPSSSATGGRGLGIVAEIADDWGVVQGEEETTVWAVVRGAGARHGA